MSVEAKLTAVLMTIVPRTYPDVAPVSTPRPYLTYQHIGGVPWRFLDGAAADRRHSMIQVNVWADSRQQALALMRNVEDAVCNSPDFVAQPDSEPVGDVEDIDGRMLYGCMQDFSIWALR